MKRLAYRYLLVSAVVAVLGLVLPMSHVSAQDLVNVYWDFRTSDYGAEAIPYSGYISPAIVPGAGCALTDTDFPTFTYSAGVGFDAGYYEFWPGHCGGRFGRLKLPDDIDLRHIDMQDFVIYWSGTDAVGFRIEDGTWPSPSDCCSLLSGESGRGTYRAGWTQNPPIDNLRNLEIEMADYNGAAYQITGIAFSYYPNDDDDAEPGTLTRPLKSEDTHPQWGMFDYQYITDNDPENDGVLTSDFPNTVYAFSNKADAKVSAVAPGTVIDMKSYTGKDCDGAFVVLQSLRRCRIFIPAFITQETSQFVFNYELINVWVITVEDEDDSTVTYSYWLADPIVSVGDQVVAGCVLGKTIQIKNPTNTEITDFNVGVSGNLSESGDAGISASGGLGGHFRSLLVDAGVTTVVAKQDGEPIRLLPSLTEEPDLANCKASTVSNCTLDNAQLKSKNGIWPEGWGTGQSSIIDGGGVHLFQGGSLIQDPVVIRPDIGYSLSVLARVTTPIESFYPLTLKVGTSTTTRPVTEGDYQLLTWQLTAREVTTTDIGVINQFTDFNSEIPVEVDIKYVCFSPDTASVAPGDCYFGNHGFDADGQGWTPFGNVTFASGQAFMGDSSLLEQGALLMPNADSSPATYHLKALVRLNASAAYTGQIDKSIELKYAFPVESGYESLGVIDSTVVEAEGRNTYDGNVNIEHVYQLTQDIEISSNTDGLFSFGVLITDTDGYLKGLRIDSLCLTPDTVDGSFPGQITGGGFSPPFIERCAIVPTPVDNNISSWTYYHWKNLERFFDCTLMVKLNQIFSLINDAWKTTRQFMRWTVVLVNRTGDWFTTLVWWLGGHFRNIAYGQVTTVYQEGGGSCNDLFCVLNNLITGILTPITSIVNTLLSLLTVGVNLLLTVITGIIGLALGFLTRLLGLFNQATGLLGGILNAYNTATPTAVDGLPMCNIDPTSSLFCRGTWLLDNTILGGRWGILITLIIGVAGIHLILWVIGEFKSAIVTTGSGS